MTVRTKAWTTVCLPMCTYRLNPIVRFRAYFGRFVVLTTGVIILIRLEYFTIVTSTTTLAEGVQAKVVRQLGRERQPVL
jgi:hypothetical protein